MTTKEKLITEVNCPKCQTKFEVWQDKKVLEPMQPAVVETTYRTIISKQVTLDKTVNST